MLKTLKTALACSILSLIAPSIYAASIVDPGFGDFAFSGGPGELSGLARISGNDYVAVSDSGGQLLSFQIQVDSTTGAITSAVPGASIGLAGGSDLEGVVYDASTGNVLVSDEVGPAIREHDLGTGDLLGSVAVPTVYGQARINRSLESLALDPVTGGLWTANEEALLPDGPVSTFAAGSVIRLQHFDAARNPDGQWAYVTDPIPAGPFGGFETSGVVDLLQLPSGELLVLERNLSSEAFRSRIYLADLAGATDTSGLASLEASPFVAVQKTLLWEGAPSASNFEGIALGPKLDAGDWSLLLVSDAEIGGFFQQTLYSLRVSFVPEPAAGVLLALSLAGLALGSRIGTTD